jgi:hypothetical protein
VLVFAGRAFELNGTVITEEQKNQLWAHFTEYSSMEANGITLSAMFDIPAEFEDFEIPYYD